MEKRNSKPSSVRKFMMVQGNGFPLVAKKINPNAPCECGSGKKAKKCCGTETKYCYSKLNQKQLIEKQLKEEAAKQKQDQLQEESLSAHVQQNNNTNTK